MAENLFLVHSQTEYINREFYVKAKTLEDTIAFVRQKYPTDVITSVNLFTCNFFEATK